MDYGSGNIRSIHNGFKKIGADTVVSSDKKTIADADAIILPGVGAFGAVMNNLIEYKDIVLDHIADDKPLLGICLGLHMLFSESEETENIEGLNIFKGSVKRFDLPADYKIPHMGWNQIRVNDTESNNCELLRGCDDKYMYFVHSYYIDPEDKDLITAYTNYGHDVPVAIGRGNVHALQFHPEKSGANGLEILRRFVNLIE
ncbi:MAG: imidazole glycerol phosphate synthase subunit HisH [Methanosphaera sp.]|uniref:imidazole glycerol phosphate synthase subunit HisH n=1 Tax=Methanosphaera sp. TaxID=2666342 RepID=UPI0025FD3491|nr:imidazole glycerol phosphate synthase subunit HisH [Methanosphaera sp.]MCI5866826.1 imidazole glycerol phosphate synthase subunit HisH [Methanosphaera sp.]MDD6534333.1 imidazole glycerol phosphate synthase subunit HisH [Methanosphaera sp.]MDY3955262.1 imidazole glycerol phosphate synthase subunit HisH [Methanosphaera sp.]